MKEAHTFRTRTPCHVWPLVALAGLLLLPGSPLVVHSQAGAPESGDAASVERKLAELERVCEKAGLTAEETKTALGLAKRVQADKRELFKLQANGKLSDAEQRAVEKLVKAFGHPLEKDLAKLREVASSAKLTAEETAAAEKLALQEGFDNEAILRRYESGKVSPVEKAAVEKVLALQGHPRAEELEQLQEAARQAGLSDQELQTLRSLADRVEWKLEKIKEWQQANQLSEAEASAVAKLAPVVARAAASDDAGKSEKARAFRQVAKLAGLTAAETEAVLEALQQAGGDEHGLLEAKKSGKLAAAAGVGLKKLEGLLGKLEDFVASPHKRDISKLLEASSQAGLTTEETGALLKLALRTDFDIDAAKGLNASGKLSELEARALDKLLVSIGR